MKTYLSILSCVCIFFSQHNLDFYTKLQGDPIHIGQGFAGLAADNFQTRQGINPANIGSSEHITYGFHFPLKFATGNSKTYGELSSSLLAVNAYITFPETSGYSFGLYLNDYVNRSISHKVNVTTNETSNGTYETIITDNNLRVQRLITAVGSKVNENLSIGLSLNHDFIFESSDWGTVESSGFGYGISYTLGLKYDVSNHLNFGFVYKSKVSGDYSIEYTGSALSLNNGDDRTPYFIGYEEADETFYEDSKLGFGLQYFMSPSFIMITDVYYTLVDKDDEYYKNASNIKSSKTDIHIGFNYEINQKSTFRFGAFTMNSLIKNESSFFRIFEHDNTFLSIGYTYNFELYKVSLSVTSNQISDNNEYDSTSFMIGIDF